MNQTSTAVDGSLLEVRGPQAQRRAFDKIVVGLSQAVSRAGDEQVTNRIASLLAAGIGSNIGRFDESFEIAVGAGQGAALAGAVAEKVEARGERNSSGNIVEGIERGSETFQSRFDKAADKVDKANQDLLYLIAQWGPMYGDSEEGQEALQARIEEFKKNRPEYQELNELSTNIGADLEVLHDLQSLFPEKQHLKDRERDWLKEIPRFGATENGRRSLAEAVERSGEGGSFLDRLKEPEFEDIRAEAGQQALTSGLSSLVQAVKSGDRNAVRAASQGLTSAHALLGESSAAMEGVIGDLEALAQAALSTGAAAAGTLSTKAGNLANSADGLNNSVTATKFKTAGALITFATGAVTFVDDPSWENSISPIKALLEGGEVLTRAKAGGLYKSLGKGAKILNGVGIALDAYGAVTALQDGDLVGAGISAGAVVGGLVTMTATTGATLGIGLAVGVGSAVAGLVRAHYDKVQASNHFESAEARRFIRGALREAGVPDAHIEKVVGHFSNADNEGRQVGILIAQAAERAGISPKRLIQLIGHLSPNDVLDIVEAGHGVDPSGDSLYDLPQSNPEQDQHVGTEPGWSRDGWKDTRPRTVEGFLLYLERVHDLDVR